MAKSLYTVYLSKEQRAYLASEAERTGYNSSHILRQIIDQARAKDQAE